MKSLLTKQNKKINVLGVKLNCGNYDSTINLIDKSIKNAKNSFVCVAAVHLIMEAYHNEELRKNINKSLLNSTDGMPLVFLARVRGHKNTTRVYGPDLTLKLCALAQTKKYLIYLLGGAKGQGKILEKKLKKRFPKLKIVGYHDTPHRPITITENHKIIKEIREKKANLILVGLGCPLQEQWMIDNYQKLNGSTCVGVGAAFNFISGNVKQAPPWMQKSALEWLFRLIQEPKRLWKRYLVFNTQFVYLLIKEKLQKQ